MCVVMIGGQTVLGGSVGDGLVHRQPGQQFAEAMQRATAIRGHDDDLMQQQVGEKNLSHAGTI